MAMPELPKGWVWKTVGEVTIPVDKIDPEKKPEREFLYFDISSIDNRVQKIAEPKTYYGAEAPSRARQLVRAGDVLFSTVRTYLKNIALIPDIYDGQVASTGFSVLRAKEGLSYKYLFYYCLTSQFLTPLAELQRGTSYPAVRDQDVRVQSIPLPPLPEQQRIVAKIEELFTQLEAGVAALQRARLLLRRYREAVLKAAVTGELTRAWREAHRGEIEPAEVLLEKILEKHKERGKYFDKGQRKESTLTKSQDLPEGWVWATVEQVKDRIQYGTSDKASSDPSGMPVLRMGNIKDGQLDFSDLKYLVLDELSIEDLVLEPGDILFNRTNSAELVGKTAVYKENHPRATFASYLIRVKLNTGYFPDLLSIVINSPYGRGYIRSVVSQQVGQANVNGSKLAAMPIPLPPYKEQKLIVEEVESKLSIADEINSTVDMNLMLAERLRQSILAKAFSGKLVPQEPHDQAAAAFAEEAQAEIDKISNMEKLQQLRLF